MRKTFLAFLFSAATCLAADSTAFVTLAWDPVPDLENDLAGSYNLYHGTVGGPWVILTNVPATQWVVRVEVVRGPHLFTCTASNFWGESTNSNVVSTPRLLADPTILHIYRAPP